MSTHPTGTHGTSDSLPRRAGTPTPPPREGAAPCGGPSTPPWSLPNSSADSLRAAAIEAARQANAERLERILATLAVVVILAAIVAAMTSAILASVRP